MIGPPHRNLEASGGPPCSCLGPRLARPAWHFVRMGGRLAKFARFDRRLANWSGHARAVGEPRTIRSRAPLEPGRRSGQRAVWCLLLLLFLMALFRLAGRRTLADIAP